MNEQDHKILTRCHCRDSNMETPKYMIELIILESMDAMASFVAVLIRSVMLSQLNWILIMFFVEYRNCTLSNNLCA